MDETKKIKGRPKTIKSELRHCKQCRKQFTYSNYSDRLGLFCSRKCFIQLKRENATAYRIKAFALLPNLCFYCNEDAKNKLLVHHLDNDFLNNKIENLQIICAKCHNNQHNNRNITMRFNKFKEGQILRGIRYVLDGLRMDISDDNFKGTPERVLRMYYELLQGCGKNSEKEIDNLFSSSFPSTYNGIILSKNIICFSMCPHHLLPVEYTVDIGYIPQKNMLGVSKISRLVNILARRLVLQETFTKDIITRLTKSLEVKGAMVVVTGKHMCMRMRGIEQEGSAIVTSSIGGIFETDLKARQEFLNLREHNFSSLTQV